MSALEQLRNRLENINKLLFDEKSTLQNDPNNFALKLSVRSLEDHVSDLAKQIELAEAEQEKSLIELRLIGEQVKNGSIPLKLLSKIASPFSSAVTNAALKLHSNNKYTPDRETIDNFERSLDLRLSSLGVGSTKLYITGNVTADLGGDSFLPNTLETIFALLNANEENFYDLVHHIGYKSAKSIEEFVSVLDKENLSADCSWSNKNGDEFFWKGRKEEITKIKYLLEKTDEPEVIEISIKGVVNLLSETGRIEITPDNEHKIKVMYKSDLFPQVAKLSLGDRAIFKIEKTSFFNSTVNDYVYKYKLLDVLS
ncbi:hypothetical protein [Neisseria sp. Ec49-e6-T10]|uniref:hypothetical protein n=1 Tax=Neisseria sp. Ec49-e6-T10 TaxID=3140744 RepID=UPI003EBAB7CE